MDYQSSLFLVDTHCHLNFDVFNSDRDQVVERARKNGITRILNPGIDIETSKSAINCAREFPEVYAAVGVHPNECLGWKSRSLAELNRLAIEKKVVAIGEIGLDYYRNRAPKGTQQSIFRQQLELAARLNLPVIIHNRDANDDMLNIIQEWHHELVRKDSSLMNCPGVMHSFSGDITLAKVLVSLHFKIGIDGPVTYHNSQLLQSVVSSLPLESLFIETDAPFLTPQPLRGKRNEPANVRIVAEKISSLKDEPLDRVITITTTGADRLFGWREAN